MLMFFFYSTFILSFCICAIVLVGIVFVFGPLDRSVSCQVAMDLLFQEMRDACLVSSEVVGRPPFAVITVPVKFSCGTVTATKLFSHRGRSVTRKEWDVVREKKSKEEARQVLLTERACRNPFSEHHVPFWSERLRRFKRASVFCVLFRRSKGGPVEWELAMAGRSGSFPLLQRCASIFSSQQTRWSWTGQGKP